MSGGFIQALTPAYTPTPSTSSTASVTASRLTHLCEDLRSSRDT